MPDTRTHRGPHPEDDRLFARETWAVLRRATGEFCWLLSRGYAKPSALKLVGDRHQLAARQRLAVERCACADVDRRHRLGRRIGADALSGQVLRLDGYNVLTTVEVALGGGVLLAARDETYRDLASMHGTYRKVTETLPALEKLGHFSAALGTAGWHWYFDRPVSNSGRLKRLMLDLAAANGWPWTVELVPDPDGVLADTPDIIATADSAVLDRGGPWFNLAREVVDREVPAAKIVPLGCFVPRNASGILAGGVPSIRRPFRLP